MRWGRKMLPNASKFLCEIFLWDSTWLPSSPWSSKHLWCLSIFLGNCWLTYIATFLISHQEEDTALLFLPKKCEVSERHVACPQELLGFKPGTSILLVHNSLVQNEKSRESSARCIRHPKAALLRTSSHVSISNLKSYYHMMLNHITPVRGVNESQHASFLSSPQEKWYLI